MAWQIARSDATAVIPATAVTAHARAEQVALPAAGR